MVWYLSRLSHTGALPRASLDLISAQVSHLVFFLLFLKCIPPGYFRTPSASKLAKREVILERNGTKETTTVQLNHDKKHKTSEKYYRPSCRFLRKTGWITNNFDSVFPYFITSRGLDECLNEPALTEVTFSRFRNSINVFKWYKVASSYKKKENVLRRICEAFFNVYILPFT